MIKSVVITKRSRFVLMFLATALFVLSLFWLFGGERADPTVGQKRLLPIYYVDTEEKKVAISFDASWGAEYTETILGILKENDIKTTFFLTGFWIEKYPELVKKIVAEGHELGNHTWTHPHLNTLDKESIKKELQRVHAALTDLGGKEPYLFRPPFGEYSDKVIEVADELGYKTIQWSIDSLDWKDLGATTITQRVTEKFHPGAIILFHNNGRYTADALPNIIKFAQENDYEIIPISELLYKEDYYIDSSDGAQKKNQ
ncbi:polysaccharide deacetylase family protein [Dethiobacter alkaliphilus]|uniref:Polysaccharide deacetylase n=1 Tax=Dethiobacter alkaliphilus AHT 1 TaxID=555088 RepID=C0GCT8_DETAL|nr:polysaccharide deacetylase family protein [Dethiobacter alkaliphilus]EEG79023.1 polysaccharide deacetylase [Dethiobacter alkaliphilus AHT 1]